MDIVSPTVDKVIGTCVRRFERAYPWLSHESDDYRGEAWVCAWQATTTWKAGGSSFATYLWRRLIWLARDHARDAARRLDKINSIGYPSQQVEPEQYTALVVNRVVATLPERERALLGLMLSEQPDFLASAREESKSGIGDRYYAKCLGVSRRTVTRHRLHILELLKDVLTNS